MTQRRHGDAAVFPRTSRQRSGSFTRRAGFARPGTVSRCERCGTRQLRYATALNVIVCAGQAFLLIYVAISVPVRIGFGTSTDTFSPTWFFELAVDCYFWSDIMFNFRTGYYSKDGIVVYDFAMIRTAYFKGWFPIDAVSCLPVSYIQLFFVDSSSGSGSSGNLKGLRMMRMLRLTKMLRLGRLKRIFQRYHEQMQPYMKAIKLGGMVTVAFFLAHLLACLWYGVGAGVDQLYDQEGAHTVRLMLPALKLH